MNDETKTCPKCGATIEKNVTSHGVLRFKNGKAYQEECNGMKEARA